MSTQMPVLSIVIISTSRQRLEANLPQVGAAAREVSAEVILVCQGYRPDVTRFSGVDLKVLHSNILLGISRARNCGADHASGEFICFLDDDVHPALDFFGRTVSFLKNQSAVMGVLGAIKVEGISTSGLFKKFDRPPSSHLSTYELWRLANGNSGVFRRTGLRFDPRLGVGAVFGSFEDADYLLAMSKLGKIVYMPDAVLFHPDMDESETRDTARMKSYAKGLGGCFRKNVSTWGLVFMLASVMNNLLSFLRPRFYSSFSARYSHIDAALAKIGAIFLWNRHAAHLPCVTYDAIELDVAESACVEIVLESR